MTVPIVPLLDWQRNYIEDDSRFKFVAASVQSGKSFATSHHGVLPGPYRGQAFGSRYYAERVRTAVRRADGKGQNAYPGVGCGLRRWLFRFYRDHRAPSQVPQPRPHHRSARQRRHRPRLQRRRLLGRVRITSRLKVDLVGNDDARYQRLQSARGFDLQGHE